MGVTGRIVAKLMEIGPVRRQSIIGFGSTVGLTLAGFFATIYIAHAGGPAALGAFFLLVTYVSVLSLFTDLGTSGATLSLVSAGKDRDELFSAHVAVRTLLLGITILALLVARPFFVDLDSMGLFWWLVAALAVTTAASIVSTGVYASGKGGILQLADLAGGLVRIVAQVVAVFLGYSAAGLAGGFVAGLSVTLLLNLRYLETKLAAFRVGHISRITHAAPWILATACAGIALGSIDTILLGYFQDPAAVGLYRTAFQLAALPAFTAAAVRTALYPQIVRWLKAGDRQTIGLALSQAFTYTLLFAVPAVAGGWILSDRLLYYLFGANFVPATPALVLLLPVQLMAITSTIVAMCLFALNFQREVFIANAAGAVLMLVAALLLIPPLGITGAAVACLVANLATFVISFRYLSGEVKLRLERTSVRAIVAASAVMGLLVLLARTIAPISHLFHLVAIVVAGVVVYAFLILRIDPAIRDEIRGLSTGFGIPWPGWL